MIEQTEQEFAQKVREFLIDVYGEENVHMEYYLGRSERLCDFFVRGPLTKFAIEVENNWEAVYGGAGQAIQYAQEIDAVPVIVVPKGCVEEPERTLIDRYVSIVELDL